MDILCRHCDTYVGVAGAGVFLKPEGKDTAWLGVHCWGCGRHADEVKARPYGRPLNPFQPGRVMPS